MLSDSEIRAELEGVRSEHLVIEPKPEDHQIQPASIDLTLGSEFKWYVVPRIAVRRGYALKDLEKIERDNLIYLDQPEPKGFTEGTDVGEGGEFLVTPDMFVLATTRERVEMPSHLVARVEGRSSIGRKGLIIHATAGFIDPGFKGHITLEIANLNARGIVLRAGMRICQLSLTRVEGKVLRPYGHPDLRSRYQGQIGTTTSRIHEHEDKKQ